MVFAPALMHSQMLPSGRMDFDRGNCPLVEINHRPAAVARTAQTQSRQLSTPALLNGDQLFALLDSC
jgi:hypothetical protein